jgi:hypothetical protein
MHNLFQIKKVFSVVFLVLNNFVIFSFLFAVPFKLAASTDKIDLARLGNTDAQLSLGFSLSSGNPLQQQEALYWMRKAGNNGNLKACQYLGNAYHQGIGTASNLKKSIEWYLKAAAFGDSYSLLKAGHVFDSDGFPALACAAYKLAKDRIPDTNPQEFILRLQKQEPSLTNEKIEKAFSSLQKRISTMPTFKSDFKPNAKPITKMIELDDGSTYSGKLLNGIPHGYGRKILSNGTSYIGNFVNGMADGIGTNYSATGVPVYSGMWKQGKPAK